jgi:hypothetical protein
LVAEAKIIRANDNYLHYIKGFNIDHIVRYRSRYSSWDSMKYHTSSLKLREGV